MRSIHGAGVALLVAAGVFAAPVAQAVPPANPGVRALQHLPVLTSVGEIASGGCPEVVAYASRGADENRGTASTDYQTAPPQAGDTTKTRSKYYGGVGEEMSVVVNYLAEKKYPGRIKVVANVDGVGLDASLPHYPANTPAVGSVLGGTAIDDFARSHQSGARQAIADLNLVHDLCPGTRMVVMGYSEGAAVTRIALGTTPDGARNVEGDHLDFVPGRDGAAPAVTLVFGDSTWNSSPLAYNARYFGDVMAPGLFAAGDEQGALSFLSTLSVFPAWQRALMRPARTPDEWTLTSFCHGNDPSCQFVHQTGQVLLGVPGHVSYDDDFFAAASWVTTYFARTGTPVKAAGTTPGVDLGPATAPCLPRGKAVTRTVTTEASAAGSSTFTQAWIPDNGSVSPASVSLSPGTTATLTATGSSNWLKNDVYRISAPAADLPGAPVLPLYTTRLCPA